MVFAVKKENWLFFLYALTMVAVVIEARFFISQAMIWLLFSAIFSLNSPKFPFFSISDTFKKNISVLWQYKGFLYTTIFFWIVFFSGLWSSELSYWMEKTRIRLPFIGIPLAFAWLPAISKRHYQSIFYGMLILMSIVMIGVLYNYWLHFDAINETLLHGKNIPVPMNHIRFSLLLSFAIVSGIILYIEKFRWKYSWESYVILLLVSFLAISIHILSVRSGIIALYGALAFMGFRYYIIKEKHYIKGILLLIAVGLLPIVAYQTMPSIRNKVEYAFRDYQHFKDGKGSDFSDAERIGSILVGVDIGNRYPIFGCGYGDIQQEIKQTYERIFPVDKEHKLPHNQFVMTYACAGLVGVMFFLFAFFYPILYQKNYRDWYFLALHIIIFFSFLVESTIENQIGTTLYSFFLGLGLSYNKERRD